MDRAARNRNKGHARARFRPFPDWRGRIVVLAASGPSQRQADIEEARGKAAVIVVNETWKIAPWADALYACDERWWRARGPSGQAFPGLRFIGAGVWPGCVSCGVTAGDNRMHWTGQTLGAGGNSGFQALNLAARTGARRIVLTGYDMQMTGGQSHHHGDHGAGLANPTAAMLAGCARILDAAAAEIRTRGIEVVNATRETALRGFRRVTMSEALA